MDKYNSIRFKYREKTIREIFNEDNQKQNNARVGNKPEWVGWSVD